MIIAKLAQPGLLSFALRHRLGGILLYENLEEIFVTLKLSYMSPAAILPWAWEG